MDSDGEAFRFTGLGVATYDHAERGLPHRPDVADSLTHLAGRLRRGISELPAAVGVSFSADVLEDRRHGSC
ncbi:hypothetical protein [Streptomyces sp. NPDC058401]|uniref:hypothetical protein n=1 Tax=Streptomyces sp. NPDC058401 TaxID=3346480 RepID=UPI00364679AF